MEEATNAVPVGNGVFSQIFSGLGIGLLVGVIVGLSVSPVVSIILGSLASLLAAFLGLQDGGPAEATTGHFMSRLKMSGMRMGSFGFACVTGIMLGLFIRTHDIFSVPVERQVQKWTQAGFSKEEARQFVAFQKLGVKPKAAEIQISELQKGQSSNYWEWEKTRVVLDHEGELNSELFAVYVIDLNDFLGTAVFARDIPALTPEDIKTAYLMEVCADLAGFAID